MKNFRLRGLNEIWVCIELSKVGCDLTLDEAENIVNKVIV
jgi:hypothetical protein